MYCMTLDYRNSWRRLSVDTFVKKNYKNYETTIICIQIWLRDDVQYKKK